MNGQANTFTFGNAAAMNNRTGEKITVPDAVANPYYMLYSVDMNAIKSTLAGRKVRNAQFFLCGNYASSKDQFTFYSLKNPYDARTVNSANLPRFYYDSKRMTNQEGTPSTGTRWASAVVVNILSQPLQDEADIFRAYLENGFRVSENDMPQYTTASAYKPYLVLYSDDIAFSTLEEYPRDNAYVDPRKPAEFGWKLTQETGAEILGEVVPKSATLRWRIKGQAAENTVNIADASAGKGVVAAGTFPAAALIEWCVRVTDTNGVACPWSAWFTISTTDALSVPRALYPKNLPIDASAPITFSWSHDSPTGTPQTRYELQYNTAGGAWQALATESTDRQTYTAPAGKFAAGQVMWRVRTHNSDSAVGSWSETASFIAHAAPACSITGCDRKPRPTVRWQSEGQQGFEVKITAPGTLILHNSGTRYGADKEYKCPTYLAAGPVTVAVRTQNAYGMQSGWASASFTVENAAPPPPVLKTRPVRYGAQLAWEASGFTHYLIYRNGKQIATAYEPTYTDYRAAGINTYRVRGITPQDTYADSAEQRERTLTRHGAVARLGVWDWLPLIFRQGENTTHTVAEERGIVYTHYSGRTLPTAESDGSVARTHSFDYSLETLEEVERLRTMAGQPVAYKNARGEYAEGILTLPTAVRNQLWDVSFTITEISREEYGNGA